MGYLGNKEKIVGTLLKIIPYSPIFIDLCTGSGNVGVGYFKKYNNKLVVFNDIVEEQIYLLEWILTLDIPISKTFLFDLWIDRDYFKFLLDGGEDETTKQYKRFRRFVLVNWSFGNNLKGYMYGKDIEPRKKAIHDTVLKIKYGKEWNIDMDNNASTVYSSLTDIGKMMITKDEFIRRLKKLYNKILSKPISNMYAIKNIYARILSDIRIPKLDKKQLRNEEFKKEYMVKINMQLQRLESLQSLDSLQRLQSLESLDSLQRLQSLDSLQRLQSLERLESLQSINKFTSLSMFDFDFSKYPIEETIVYIDPPYENTHGYGTPDIDYDYFWKRFNNHPYPMIASSYSARDYIKCYFILDKRKTISGNTMAKEGIYINKSFITKYKIDDLSK